MLLAQWLAERRARSAAPTGTSAQVEAWRSRLREAVLDKRVDGPMSQLGQMVHQATVLDVPAAHVGLGAEFRAAAVRPLLPDAVVLDSLHGGLSVTGCDDVAVAWAITAGGTTIAEGDLRPDHPSSLGHVDLHGHGARSTRFVLTARRTDRVRCTAALEWSNPGIDTPGIGTVL